MQSLPPRALLLAPMVELSHRPLRELIATYGSCDRYYTEMSGAPAYLADAAYDAWFLDPYPDPERTVTQFYSPDIKRMAGAVHKLVDQRRAVGVATGGVDLNFGCAAPHIEKAGGGVSWMKDAPGAADMVSAARAQAPELSLSAKLRLGYQDDPKRLLDFCQGLVGAGVDYLVLHPRFKDQKFRRSAKWSHVRELAAALSVPLIGNGDVRGYEGYRAAIEDYGAAGVMIGREAVRRPWIFALIRGLESNPDFRLEIDIEGTGLRLLKLLKTNLPPVFWLSRARRFFYYYCDNLSFSHHLRFAIQNAKDLETIERLFQAYFNEVPGDRLRSQGR